MSSPSSPSSSLRAGARAILPLTAAALPFGLVYGVAVTQSSVADWQGGLASLLVIAGAAQFALIDLIDDDAPWVVAVGTALIINLRFAMYSGALAPSFSRFPAPWRFALAHLMTDQTAVTSLFDFEVHADPVHRRWFYLGAGSSFAGVWIIGTWAGILFGADIPDSWQLGIAVPLVFVALAVPAVKDRPSLVAALVGASGCLLASPLPHSLGVVIGASAGVGAGLLVSQHKDTPT